MLHCITVLFLTDFFVVHNLQKNKTKLWFCNQFMFSHWFPVKPALLLMQVHHAPQAHQQAVQDQLVFHIHGLKISKFPGT